MSRSKDHKNSKVNINLEDFVPKELNKHTRYSVKCLQKYVQTLHERYENRFSLYQSLYQVCIFVLFENTSGSTFMQVF